MNRKELIKLREGKRNFYTYEEEGIKYIGINFKEIEILRRINLEKNIFFNICSNCRFGTRKLDLEKKLTKLIDKSSLNILIKNFSYLLDNFLDKVFNYNDNSYFIYKNKSYFQYLYFYPINNKNYILLLDKNNNVYLTSQKYFNSNKLFKVINITYISYYYCYYNLDNIISLAHLVILFNKLQGQVNKDIIDLNINDIDYYLIIDIIQKINNNYYLNFYGYKNILNIKDMILYKGSFIKINNSLYKYNYLLNNKEQADFFIENLDFLLVSIENKKKQSLLEIIKQENEDIKSSRINEFGYIQNILNKELNEIYNSIKIKYSENEKRLKSFLDLCKKPEKYISKDCFLGKKLLKNNPIDKYLILPVENLNLIKRLLYYKNNNNNNDIEFLVKKYINKITIKNIGIFINLEQIINDYTLECKIFKLLEFKDKIYIIPFPLGNVSLNGFICWGKNKEDNLDNLVKKSEDGNNTVYIHINLINILEKYISSIFTIEDEYHPLMIEEYPLNKEENILKALESSYFLDKNLNKLKGLEIFNFKKLEEIELKAVKKNLKKIKINNSDNFSNYYHIIYYYDSIIKKNLAICINY